MSGGCELRAASGLVRDPKQAAHGHVEQTCADGATNNGRASTYLILTTAYFFQFLIGAFAVDFSCGVKFCQRILHFFD